MQESTKLIRGAWLLSDGVAVRDGAVAVRGGHIEEIGGWQELYGRYPSARVYGSGSHIVIPGLINAHHHSGGFPQSLHGVEDDHLEPWLLSTMGMRAESAYPGTGLSAARLLQSGVTSVVDMTVVDGSVQEAREDTEERLRAYADAGIRAAVAPGVIHESFLVNGRGEDETFLASLPTELRRRVEELLPLKAELSPDGYLRFIEEAAAGLEVHSPQRVWYGPPGPQWSPAGLLRRIRSGAERLDTRIQTHALESFYEKLEGLRSHGKGAVEYLHDLGLLSPRMTLAHGVWLSEAEMDLLARTGAAVSHNPSSNLRLRAGTAPLNAMLGAGVPTALGLDANGINDDDDMFTEMRMALRLHRTPQLGEPAPAPADVFRMATVGGARLFGMEEELGRLAPGFRADVTLLDAGRILGLWRDEDADPLYLLVCRAGARDVDTVFINGEPVLRAGSPLGVDPGDLSERLAKRLRDTPAPERLRELIGELKPHLRSWYATWEEPGLEPYGIFNSRY
jgi:cytosine/adenosine deaminase-related metal-dependent hydrolase